MTRRFLPSRVTAAALTAGAAMACVATLTAANAAAGHPPAAHATATKPSAAVSKVLSFAQSGNKPKKHYSFAFLASCATENTYCQNGVTGVTTAARKYGATVHVYDANFNPSTQVGQVQDAVSHGYDAYLFEPAASASACSMWKQFLKPTGKPVVILDLPMCNNPDYTPGTAGIVTMQRPAYYQMVINNAFSTCKTTCYVAAVGGFTGSDLFTYWENAITKGQAKYPNAHVVVNQPGDFAAPTALSVMQDGLRANPKINMVVSSWDAMTQGVNQAVTAAGKRPGRDVRIYSIGATQAGLKYVESGTWNATYVLLPRQEGFYATIVALMALAGHPLNAFVDEGQLPQVTKGPGSVVITKKNARRFHPTY